MSFSKYSQYPVVGRISANDIKNEYFCMIKIFNVILELFSVPCGKSQFCE